MNNLYRKDKESYYPIPKSLISAISLVQRLKLVEDDKRSLDGDYIVLDQIVGLSEVSIRSAWQDSLIWMIGYVLLGAVIYFVQDTYLSETSTQVLFWRLDGSPLYWMSKAASFSGLFFSTGLCVYMCRFHVGTVCKKAVNTVITTRAVLLVTISLSTFIVLAGVRKLLFSDTGVARMAHFLSFVSKGSAADSHYFFLGHLKRLLFEAGIVLLISSAVSAAVPYLSILLFRAVRRKDRVLGLRNKR